MAGKIDEDQRAAWIDRLTFLLILDLGINGRTDELVGLLVDLTFGLHTVLKTFDRATQVATDIAKFLGPEDEQHNDEHNKPVPNAETSHGDLL
jgi:hypothetical protein